jgi:hypothetical protein
MTDDADMGQICTVSQKLFHIVARTSVEIFRMNCHSCDVTVKC